jgi:glutamate-1-semialdehyde 2,1-aminomutase
MGRGAIMSVYDQSLTASDDFVGQTGTLNGNPIACAAGLATLAELRREGAYQKLRATGSRVRQALVDACAENGVPAQSSGDDTIFDVFFTDQPVRNYRDGLAADAQTMSRFNAGLLEEGILKSWPQKFYPSLAHTEADIERTIEAFQKVVPKLRG